MMEELHGVIFVHVPKNAGFAVKTAVNDWRFMHEPPSEIREIMGHEVYDRSVRFAVVRHPCSRLVSYYHWILEKERSKERFWRVEMRKKILDVKRFGSLDNLVRSLHDGVLTSEDFLPPQTIHLLRDGEIDCQELLLFERLRDDLPAFCERYGVPHVDLRVVNSSKHEPWESYYTEETYGRVLGAYRDDYAIWRRVAEGRGIEEPY